MNYLHRFWSLFLVLFLATEVSSSQLLLADQEEKARQSILESASPFPNEEGIIFSDNFFKKYADEVVYLDLNAIGNEVTKNLLIGTPPKEGSQLQKGDKEARVAIGKEATVDEKLAALRAIDNVFAFSVILGDHFSYKDLKCTAAFFETVDSDVGNAVAAAKKTFQRPRPMKSNGFSYPSGHSTRAFVREELLSEIFPNCQEALYHQAWQFAQNRVIIGRHYPMDIAAGEVYGKYLADQFRKNPEFRKKWEEAKKEIEAVFSQPDRLSPMTTPLVTPALSPIIVDYLHAGV